jgi:hypothetical protein
MTIPIFIFISGSIVDGSVRCEVTASLASQPPQIIVDTLLLFTGNSKSVVVRMTLGAARTNIPQGIFLGVAFNAELLARK